MARGALRVIAAGAVSLALAACNATAGSGAAAPAGAAGTCGSVAACEQRATTRLDAVRNDPVALTNLLQRFPKGADLHNHLAGAVYAESYLAWAREDGLRVDDTLKLIDASKCGSTCADIPASSDPQFDAIVRAWSMKDFRDGAETGHDHFFASFKKFSLVSHEVTREGAMLAETLRRAADDGAIYLEVLVTVARPVIPGPGLADDAGVLDPEDLPAFQRKLHADPRWDAMIASARDHLADRENQARELLRCGRPDAVPGCDVTVRYLGQVDRTGSPAKVFAELLAAFEVSATEPRVAGINLVAPEDNAVALRDYDLQMALIAALKDEFRGRSAARVTLHAGELTAGLVAAEDLAFHVRHAVEIAHAERIGHGVDVLLERDAPGLLAEMRERGVAVEICLSSNASILNVAGPAHPLSAYLSAGVPVTLATDDAGVSRTSLTGELVRAVVAQGLRYPQLKALVRNSLSAAFVSGPSLWEAAGAPHLVAACATGVASSLSPACAAFLAGSERARLQWKLEQQLAAFEAE